ncbi:hypothetical protein ON010_g15993 [Phytophthora cinnamomi]|nr:hypothetical protein ON010_g15993 [Phytophthora cinnamomi]
MNESQSSIHVIVVTSQERASRPTGVHTPFYQPPAESCYGHEDRPPVCNRSAGAVGVASTSTCDFMTMKATLMASETIAGVFISDTSRRHRQRLPHRNQPAMGYVNINTRFSSIVNETEVIYEQLVSGFHEGLTSNEPGSGSSSIEVPTESASSSGAENGGRRVDRDSRLLSIVQPGRLARSFKAVCHALAAGGRTPMTSTEADSLVLFFYGSREAERCFSKLALAFMLYVQPTLHKSTLTRQTTLPSTEDSTASSADARGPAKRNVLHPASLAAFDEQCQRLADRCNVATWSH